MLGKTFGIMVAPGKGAAFARAMRTGVPDDPLVRGLLESLLATLTVPWDQPRVLDRRFAQECPKDRVGD